MIDESEDVESFKLQGKMFSTTIIDPRKIVESQASPKDSAVMYSKEQIDDLQ
jgi:hypothetical protein